MKRQRGFSLVELISIIVLTGVLYVFAAPGMFDTQSIVAIGLHDETLSFLRFAQKNAVAQRRLVCVEFTENSVALYNSTLPDANSCNSSLKGPGGEMPGVVTGKENAAYEITPRNFNFDGSGRPVDPTGAAMLRQSIHVKLAESAIIVEPVTGYVHD